MQFFFRELSWGEMRRVKRAADYLDMPWRAICRRPTIARLFYTRVETEMRAQAFKILAVGARVE